MSITHFRATYARQVLDWGKATGHNPKIIMADIGAKDGDVTGGHQKNAIKYVHTGARAKPD